MSLVFFGIKFTFVLNIIAKVFPEKHVSVMLNATSNSNKLYTFHKCMILTIYKLGSSISHYD